MNKLIVTENELPKVSQEAIVKLRRLMRADAIGNCNINRTLLLHPVLGAHWMALGEKLTLECDLDPKLRELIILRTAYFYDCNYELHYHLPIAEKVGLSVDVLCLLKDKSEPCFFPEEWQLVVKFCDQVNKYEIAEYETLIDTLGREKLIAIVSLIGFYTFIASFVRSLQIPLP